MTYLLVKGHNKRLVTPGHIFGVQNGTQLIQQEFFAVVVNLNGRNQRNEQEGKNERADHF